MRRLDTKLENFEIALDSLVQRTKSRDSLVLNAVSGIIADVRARGDIAVLEHTSRLDEFEAPDVSSLEVSSTKWCTLDLT